MKKSSLLLALCLLFASMSCSKEDKQSFANVDHDKDGGIIFEELVFVYPDTVVENFAAYDADQNGILDQPEYKTFYTDVVVDKKTPQVARLAPTPTRPSAQTPTAAVQPDITVTLEPEKAPAKSAEPQAAAKKTPATAAKAPEKQAAGSYTIQRGDNLTKIAKKHGLSVDEILRANDGLSADSIRDGQVITIPGR
ncbi:LysM peptidoglycan-binding domain-containing protein [Desulfovibrio sulfodismutans]|uniref:LysM peptidoglycan-binding domain-containing protein n=1 Tax=Desulfolutivibrio sulfodismutans TaxID=63561 RepID=A0A7K3NKH2_9BACT|nr:LysM domain-containing protein [Desulfolutivibrio sulfodismutans]NDY56680.1 LysM peptidoglycan-binding domain-containing protein [Desulfolutivibrio sulfodismutans]QLA11220.1 LysM peptidoglycan-binding domain-containing protein [Desulfolutivibrio sulfodismutans DSM 3696]